MAASKVQKLILLEHKKHGEILKHQLLPELQVHAQPGSTYTLVDEDTGVPPKGMVLKRKGHSLIVENEDVQVADIQEFYDDHTAAFSTDGSFTGNPETTISADTPSATAAASDTNEALVWPLDHSSPAAFFPEINPLVGVLGGLGVVGLAASGGGGGSGNSGNTGNTEPAPSTPDNPALPDTTPPSVPASVSLLSSDPNDGSNPGYGVDIKVVLPADAQVGDKIVTVVKFNGGTVATIETTVTEADLGHGYATQHIDYTTIDPDGVIDDGTYETVTNLIDAAGNSGEPLVNSQAFVAFTGLVHDDYVANATVFVDSNNNGQWDAGEAVTTTDSHGHFKFTFDPNGAPVLAMGGIDTASGAPNTAIVYKAYSGNMEAAALGVDIVLSPLSTLISSVAEQTVGAGGKVDAAALANAASLVNSTLGLGVADPVSLLTFDPVAAATGTGATAQDISLLAVNRQLTVLLGATGSLIDGAATAGGNAGGTLATNALASVVIAHSDSQTGFNLTSASDVEAVLGKAMDQANKSGTTSDLRASNPADLTAVAGLVAGFSDAVDKTTSQGALSTEALSTMRAVSDSLFSALSGAGSEAESQRGGDLSLSSVITQVGTIPDVGTYVADQVANVADVNTAFETNTATGYVGNIVHLDIQLPSLGLGKTVDTLSISGVPNGVSLLLVNPLTKAQTVLTPDSHGVYQVKPADVGYLAVRSTVTATDDPATVNIAENSLTLTATKLADGVTTTYTGALQLNIAPVPVITSASLVTVTDDAGSRTGNLTSGASTDDATPTIGGTINRPLAGGEQVAVYDGNTLLGYATVTGTGWTFTPPIPLVDGAHAFAARVVSGSTVVSGTQPFSVTVDTSLPDAPVVYPTSGGTVTGTSEPGSVITVTSGGTVIGTTTTDEHGHWTFTPSSPLPEGTPVSVTATDPAGNTSTSSTPTTVDGGVPTQLPTFTPGTGGMPANGGYTHDDTPTLGGTLSGGLGTGETLVVYDGDTPIGTATVTGTTWTFTPDTGLGEGKHDITVRVVHDGGNGGNGTPGAPSPVLSFTVDTVAPAQAVTVTSVYDDVPTITGTITNSAGYVTNDSHPGFTGTLSAPLASGESLVAYDTRVVNGVQVNIRLGAAAVSGSDWTFTPAYSLADATHSVTFRVEDKAGNVGASSTPYAFTVDTVDSAAPTITSGSSASAIDENAGSNQVVYTAGADDTADVSGGVTWSLKAGSDAGLSINAATGAVTLAADPDFESKSSYTFTVVATDAAGNRSEKTVSLAVNNLDEVAPAITSGSTASAINENSGGNQLIYTASADDSADISGGVTWSLKAGSDAGLTIDASTGAVTLSDNPDYETKSGYSFTVVATDAAGHSTEKAVSLAISNDDAPLSIAVSDTSIVEGSLGTQKVLTYTVSRALTTGAGTVDWSVGGDVDASTDLSGATSGTLSFAAGEATKTFTVTVLGDKTIEGSENLVVSLSNPQGDVALDTSSSATTSIVNDDGTVSISVDKADIVEGSTGSEQVLTYTVTRTNGVAPAAVNWSLSGVDAADLAAGQATGGTISFAADETTRTFTVTVTGDKAVEANESLVVSLSSPGDNLSFGTASATTAVHDDDSLISVAATRGSVLEGNNGETQVVVFRLTRTSGDSATSVGWALDGSVTADDLAAGQATSGTVSFAANELEKFVSVTVTGDRSIEANEALTIKLSNAGDNAAIGVASATTTIVNDDNGVSVESISTTVVEGATGEHTPIVFRVVRSDTSAAASVDYRIVGVGADAVTETDFDANQGQAANAGLPSGTVSFAAGQSVVLVTVQVAGDAVYETDETYSVVLSNPSAGTQILQGQISGAIVNDDMRYSITAQEAATLEGTGIGGVQHFVVTRQGDVSHASTVGYTIAGYGDNNASDDDFTSLINGSVTFAAGETATTLAIDITGDSQLEGYEAFKVSLNPADSHTEIQGGVALATINPDDVGITIVANNSKTFEDGGGVHTFTITRTGYLGGSSVVSWQVEGNGDEGYRADANDFGGQFPSGTVTFAPGQDSIEISFTPRADVTYENNEGYRVVLGTTQPGVILLQDSADGMLLNDESGLTLEGSNLDRMEGNPGDESSVSFNIARSGNIKTESVVHWELQHEGTSADDFAPGTPLSGTITFAVGEDNKVVFLPLSTDNIIEADKDFKVVITSETVGTEVLVGTVDGVIRNDDAQFALQALTSVTEGNGGSKAITMTVVRTGDLSGSDTVDYTVSGAASGTAASGADFIGGNYPHGTVLFTAGQATQTITINIAADSVVEADENFTVTLGNNSSGTTIAPSGTAQTVTILNDDDSLSIAATDAVKAEGGSGMTDYVFTVTRDGFTDKSTAIGWNVQGTGGNPANAADFGGTLPSGTVSFGAGETVKTITVAVSADNFNEADESFRVVLGAAPAGTEVSTGSASGTIINDDTGLAIAATTTNLAEGDSGSVAHVFTVTRSGVITGSTTVDWTVSGAVDAADFGGTLPSGTVSFGAGETVKTITLMATGDTTIENTEGFSVVLSNASSNADIQVASANGSIVADDIQIAITASPSASLQEGADGTTQVLSYTVTRSGDTASAAVIDWAANGMDADDFANGTPFSGSLSFGAGETVKVINLTLKGDNVYEADDTLTLTLTNPDSNPAKGRTYIEDGSVQTVVSNDDVSLAITANNASQPEGAAGDSTAYVFTITPTGVIGADSVVEWHVSSAQAASNDFVAGQDVLGDNNGFPSGTVTFAAGQTDPILVTVNVAGDSNVEASESFSIDLSTSAANVQLATASANATIVNDDTDYSIVAVSADHAEGNAGTTEYVFNVVRGGVAAGSAEVTWTVTGSGTNAADADDFGGTLPSGTVTFADGETTRAITVLATGDTVVENDEGFTVTLTGAPSPITTESATGTIRNEDQQYSVSSANATLTEGDSGTQPLIFTVTRTGDTSVASEVGYSVTGSAGVDSNDYVGTLPSGTLSFAANEGTKLVTIQVRGDNIAEGDDSFTLTLDAPSVGTLDGAHTSATTTIVNNDVALDITAPVAALEGDANGGVTPFVFTVTRSGATGTEQTVVDWVVEGGSTTLADFVAGQDSLNANAGLPSGKITFAAGETVALVTINVAQDLQVELDETINVVLKNPTTENVELHTASASTTVLADDSGYSIAAVDAVKTEGEGAASGYVFSITRGGDLSSGASAHWAVSGSGGNPADAADFNGSLPSGDVSFGVSESVKLVTVLVSDDQQAEFDENFTITLSGPANIVDATATGTIVNDDQNFSVSTSNIAEGNSSTRLVTFTVTRTGDMSGTATVDYAMTTADASADDYVGSLPAGTLTFAPDQNQQVVTLAVQGDTLAEADESYTLTLSAPTGGATLATAAATATVTNDDTNYVLSAPADTYEGHSGTTPVVFTVARSGDLSAAGSVQWKLQAAAGVATNDFAGNQDSLGSNAGLPSGTVSFAANASVATITINVAGDTALEGDETLHVVLSNPVGGTIEGSDGDKSMTLLTDDDSFAISGATDIWEGQTDKTVVYTIDRTGSLVGERTLTWTISGANGFSTADDLAAGQASTGTVSFADGASIGYLTVAVKGDTVTESDETMTVTLSGAPDNTLLDTPSASTLIRNDDARVGVTTLLANVPEGSTPGGWVDYTFTVTRSGYTGQSSTVNWSIDTGATDSVSASDFRFGTLPSGTVSFGISETTKIITLQIAQDSTYEPNETLRVALSNPSAGTEIDTAHTSADGIVSNDDAKFDITAGTVSLSEGDNGFGGTAFVYTVTRTGNLNQVNTVHWDVAGGTANAEDFSNGSNQYFGNTPYYDWAQLPNGTLTFASGVSAMTITVTARGDTNADYEQSYWSWNSQNRGSTESDETFNVQLSAPNTGSSLGTTTSFQSTIVNDDTRLTMTVNDASQPEKTSTGGTTDFVYTVTRSGDTSGVTTANWNVLNYGTDANDFTGATSGTVSFAAGVTVQTFTVQVQGDDTVEGMERFLVQLNGGGGYDELDTSDSGLQPAGSSANLNAYIERDEATFDIVNYSDSYYRYLGHTAEGDSVGDGGTGSNTYVIQVARGLAWAGEATVTWNVSGYTPGSYTPGYPADAADADDFYGATLPSGTLTFADGQTYGYITLTINGDDLGERDEGFQIQLTGTSPGSSVGSSGNGYVIIDNDDTTFSVALTTGNAGVTEGQDLVYTITRNDDTRGSDTVQWSWTLPGTEASNEGNTDHASWYQLDSSDIVTITAEDGSTVNYDSTTHTYSGTVTFTDGQATRTITVATLDDLLSESWREAVPAMTISNPVNISGEPGDDLETPAIDKATSETTWVFDNEPDPLLSVSSSVGEVWEGTDLTNGSQSNAGNTVTFTVTRSDVDGRDGALDYATVAAWKLSGTNINWGGNQAEVMSYTVDGVVVSPDERYSDTTYGTVSFAAGETTKTVTVTFYGDAYAEADKTLNFSVLSAAEANAVGVSGSDYGPANYDVANASTEVLLKNDDIQLTVTPAYLTQYGNVLGNYEGQTISFTVSRTGRTDVEVTGTYELSGAAVDSGNVTGTLTGTFTLAAGQTSAVVTLSSVTLVDDSAIEGNEPFTLTLNAQADDAVNNPNVYVRFDDGTSGTKVMTGQVFDDDSSYAITNVSASTQTELDYQYTDYVFQIQRTNSGATEGARVHWKVEGLGGITSDDFATGDSLGTNNGLPSGYSDVIWDNDYAYVTVTVRPDLLVEGNDTFRLVVDGETLQYSGITNTFSTPFVGATQTITNDDTGISIADVSITESDANQSMVFTVTRSGDLNKVSTMDWMLNGLTIDADDIVGATNGALTFASGVSAQTITITVAGDVTPEASESFHITLSNLYNVQDPIDIQSVGTINNDDSSFAISAGAAVAEGGGQVFTITRSHATVQDQEVSWSVAGVTNGATADDFASGFPGGTVTFSGNELTKLVTITANADTATETNEEYTVTIGLGNGTSGDTITASSATGTVINNDADYTVTAKNATTMEGHAGLTPVVFTIARSGATGAAATVDWTLGGDVDAGDLMDGQATSGTVSFAADQTTTTITINVVADTTVESDEALTITLSNANGADGDNIVGGPATTTIVNDDSSISIVALDAVKAEGNSATTAYTFNIVRTGYLGAAATVHYDVTGSGVHPADSADFNGMTGTLNLPADQATTTLTILVNGDQAAEFDEGFTVTLSSASSGVTIDTATADGSIVADDTWFDVTSPGAQLEGTNLSGTTDFAFVVTRSGDLSASQVVNWTVAGSGSDPADASDFAATSGAVTFAANETAATIHVQVNQDSALEATENFTLSLTGPEGVHFSHSSAEASIIDDETAFSISPTTLTHAEGADGITNYVFTVTRTGKTSGNDSVEWSFSSTQADASDFDGGLPAGGVLSFAANQTAQTITIGVLGDEQLETDENFTITLGGNSAGTQLVPGASSATATIGNDDSSIAISALNADQAEGHSGTVPFTFDVVRTGNLSTQATVAYTLSGTGIDAADFSGLSGGLSGTLNLAAGQATTTLTIYVQGDRVAELDENFTVTLSDPSTSVTIAAPSAVGTIRADDVVFDVTPPAQASQLEGATGDITSFEFVVTRDGKLSGAQVLTWDVAGFGGNAADAADFVTTTGTVSFAAGETAQTITVQVKGDYNSEPDESFRLTLSSPTGDDVSGVSYTHQSADAVILNDEASFTIAATDTNKVEGASGTVDHVFTVTRTGNLNLNSTVSWGVSGGAADADDFDNGALPAGSLTFAAGVSVQTITVKTVGDTTTEADESFTVSLSNASTGANIITGAASGKIVSDDVSWSVSTESIPASEGDGPNNYVFRVVRTGGTQATSIDWNVSGDGTSAATADDFASGLALPSGNVVFAQGVMTQFITVQVAGDSVKEADEGFAVTLTTRNDGLTHAYAQQTATATIVNDDDVMSIAAASTDKAEGSSGTTPFTFTVTRDGSLGGMSTVGWHIVHGDTDDADFGATSGTVTFADGQSVATVTVNVIGDREVEADQAFNVELVNAGAGSTIDGSHATASGTIRNDDVDLSLSAEIASATEGDLGNPGHTTFTVTRSGDLSVQTTVDWNVVAGTATATDFAGGMLPGGTVTFAAGESVQTITVNLAGDGIDEGNEDFTVQLSNQSAHADITSNNVAGSIVDDDDTLTVSAFLATANEGNAGQTSNYVFQVERTGTATGSATVDWHVAGSGTHAVGSDEFVAASGSVSFADGETSTFVTVQVKGDAVGEYDETFSISLSNPSYGSTAAATTATGTVVNDDAVLFVRADQPDGQLEGINGAETQYTFTVIRSGDASGTSTVDWHVEPSGEHAANAMDFGGAYPSGTVVFGAGETTKLVTVALLGDADGEFDETFSVVLGNAVQATILEGSAESVILNDDTGISIAAQGSVDQLEGNTGTTPFVYRVERVGSLGATTVDWTVAGSGDYQVNGDDFASPTSGTISFADGQSYADITLQVAGDDSYGPDENFRVVLSNNDHLINTEATGVIRNDDSVVAIVANTISRAEGDSGNTDFVFVVTRSGATQFGAEVSWDVTGSGGHPADAADFGGNLPGGVISFAADETTRLITVSVSGDTLAETNEGFTVRLDAAAGSGASVDPTRAEASSTIVADDQGVLIFGLDTDHAEGQAGSNTTFTYQVLRTGDTSQAVTVNYDVSGNVDADDFVSPLAGSFVMAAGQDSYVLTLTARGDALVELDEAFQVALSGMFATNAPVDSMLRGDDDGISIVAHQGSVSEADGSVVFDIVASGILGDTTVNWSVDGLLDGVEASDFVGGVLPSGSLHFAVDSTQSITLQLADDSTVEPNESLSVTLDTSGPVGDLGGHSAAVTVTDNDSATAGNDVIEGNDTADVLYGHGGADVIQAGGGDDVIVLDADNMAQFGHGMQVDGGSGIDTLFTDAADQTFDLSAIGSHVTGIERMDISGTGANTLNVTADALSTMETGVFNVDTNMPDALHQLMIEGDANDTVVIADFSNGWTKEASEYTDSHGTYDVYTNATNHVQLLIDIAVTQQTVTQPT